jgi:hypothetical protein
MPTNDGRGGAPRPRVALALILAGTLVPRLAALPAMDARHMGPDSAHFLNVARCFERGQGFSNPSAWPAWMKPARLPMPETFKEPGYSWLIAQAAHGGADPFHAAQAMSLIAGLLLPFVVWLLARQLDADPLIALIAALIASGSPLLVDKSVRCCSWRRDGACATRIARAGRWRSMWQPARCSAPLTCCALRPCWRRRRRWR